MGRIRALERKKVFTIKKKTQKMKQQRERMIPRVLRGYNPAKVLLTVALLGAAVTLLTTETIKTRRRLPSKASAEQIQLILDVKQVRDPVDGELSIRRNIQAFPPIPSDMTTADIAAKANGLVRSYPEGTGPHGIPRRNRTNNCERLSIIPEKGKLLRYDNTHVKVELLASFRVKSRLFEKDSRGRVTSAYPVTGRLVFATRTSMDSRGTTIRATELFGIPEYNIMNTVFADPKYFSSCNTIPKTMIDKYLLHTCKSYIEKYKDLRGVLTLKANTKRVKEAAYEFRFDVAVTKQEKEWVRFTKETRKLGF